ncbi:MAG TPA: hypothetical protein VL994_11670 [Steroidobacteraceae bacterium]|nr:hypothetical protein [Steroidobacteraceae bacterium]
MKVVRYALTALILATGLAGCSSLDEMAKKQDEYNRNRCHDQYGLNPGTNEYARCVSMGANAYAEAQKSAANGNPNPPAAVVIAPAAPNHACSVPTTPKGQCAGCSVSCGSKEPSCTLGTEWPDGSGCIKNAVCECH